MHHVLVLHYTSSSTMTETARRMLQYSNLEFYLKKNKNSLFEPPFGGSRGNIRTPSIAGWKAHGRLPVRHNWTFFAISYS